MNEKKLEGGVQGEKETGQAENESVRKARRQKKRRKNMKVQRRGEGELFFHLTS